MMTAALLAFAMTLLPAAAVPPQITKVAPTLQTGAATTLVIDGTELLPNPRLVLPVPIATQTVKDGATATRVQIEVKLADGAATGVHALRLANDKGISAAVPIEIDEVPPQPFAPQIAKLPATVQGALAGSATLSTTFTGTKGQRVVIEIEARRLGSAIEPVVKLYDPRRVQLAWAQGSNALTGDTRLTTVLPADGTYTLELHDAQYKAGNPNRFRLKIGEYQYADLPFPLAGQRGTKASFQLIGSLPETTRVEADLTNVLAGSLISLPRAPGQSGTPPRILVTEIPEVIATPQAPGKLQEVTAPVAINGRLLTAKQEDRYRLSVQPKMKLRFDVLAERAGSPLDGVLTLRNEAGAQLARADDQPGTLDPGLDFTVPDGVTSLVVAVADLHGRGGPMFVYRLAVTSLGQPDFSLALLDDRVQVGRNGTALVRVKATRTGYDGPIKLALPKLPDGVTVTGTEIPAGATETLLSLTAKEGTNTAHLIGPVIGESVDPKIALRRAAMLPEAPLSRVLPELRTELAIAVTEPVPIGVVWDGDLDKLTPGATIPVKLQVSRAAGVQGQIRLSLLTSQVVPKKGNMDDPMRAVRLEGMPPMVAANQTSAEIKIVVPADLPLLPYDVAVRAELLAADGRTVTASIVTPVKRIQAAK
jgi:hypothetical protein